MFKKKKNIDERQEREFYIAEHYAYYVMFATVVIIVVIESYFLNMDFKSTIGEIIILMVGACTLLFNCLKTGNWDYHYKPSLRNYFLFSIVSAFVITFIFTIGKAFKYESVRKNIWGMAVPIGVVMFISLFFLCFAALAISGEISKKRRKELEKEFLDDEGIQNGEKNMIIEEKRIIIKSKRLVIISRTSDDMQELIDNEKDEHLKEAYQGMQDAMKEHTGKEMWYCCWKIIKKEDNVLVGGIGLFGEPNENSEVEIGYGINSEFEGNGYTTEAVKALITWIFAQQNVFYILAKTERDNLKSCRVLEKNAFKKVNEDNELLTYELVK